MTVPEIAPTGECEGMTMAWMHLFIDIPSSRWVTGTQFWSSVTGTSVSDPRGEDGQFVTLLPEHGEPWLKLQSTDGDRKGIHVDLDSADQAAARRASERLGATFAWEFEDVAVMRSPGGLLFCHTAAGGLTEPRMARDGRAIIDQICLDIPPRLWEVEVRFWQHLTGREVEAGRRPEFAFLGDPDPAGPPRILLQRLDSDAQAVTAHLDVATDRRVEETRRHEALGAQAVRVERHWTVMRAPSGHAYCLTDRDPRTGRVRLST